MSGEGSSGEKTDPGAIRHGNFINYYQFHPAEERVRQLPRGVWQRRWDAHPARKYAGLDVGCNAGVRTAHLSGIQNGMGLGLRDPKLQTARLILSRVIPFQVPVARHPLPESVSFVLVLKIPACVCPFFSLLIKANAFF